MRDVKAINMAVRLMEETSLGRIKWRLGDVPIDLTIGTENKFSLFVETAFKETRIAMYQVKYKYYHDEDQWSWSETIVIAILDDHDRVLWESESDEAEIRELYRIVRRNVSGVNKLLDYFR
jgi:hypothetical protein